MNSSETAAVDPLGTSSVDERVRAILILTDRLTRIISSETALLKSRRPSALRETEAEKTRLSGLYAREMRAIKARPELLAGIGAQQKDMLHKASVAFKSCAATHVRTLARIRAVSESLIVAIGEELGRMRKPMTRYSGPSAPGAHKPTAIPHMPAFGFDRSV